MRASRPAAALLLAATLAVPLPASGEVVSEADEPTSIAGHTVRMVAAPGVRFDVDGVRLAGPLEILGISTGLGLTERTTLDGYLEGIAEVPFDWPAEALRSQAVAARTYLAWTLYRGRTASGRRYGYDICATTACQVYAGVGVVEGWGGERWRDAVESTSGEILMYAGEPAQALYSSTSGGRTRSVEDVFPGASPTPYLRAVESPGEDSPFVDWEFTLHRAEMELLLEDAGLLDGDLIDVSTTKTEDGRGSWMVEIRGSGGVERIGTWQLRTELNAAAARVLPDVLPAMRPDVDRRYPQTILSPTFTIHREGRFVPPIDGPPMIETVFVIRGHGWGHLVGMSQFGAEAMAAGGATYPEILAHFYGGLLPQTSDELPDDVVVGLEAGASVIDVGANGPISVEVDGTVVSAGALGTWRFEHAGDGVRIIPPVGLGIPPAVEVIRIVDVGRIPLVLEAWITAAAEVRVVERSGSRTLVRSDWEVHDAGPVRWPWTAVRPLRTSIGGVLVVEARSADGEAMASIAYVPGAE